MSACVWLNAGSPPGGLQSFGAASECCEPAGNAPRSAAARLARIRRLALHAGHAPDSACCLGRCQTCTGPHATCIPMPLNLLERLIRTTQCFVAAKRSVSDRQEEIPTPSTSGSTISSPQIAATALLVERSFLEPFLAMSKSLPGRSQILVTERLMRVCVGCRWAIMSRGAGRTSIGRVGLCRGRFDGKRSADRAGHWAG